MTDIIKVWYTGKDGEDHERILEQINFDALLPILYYKLSAPDYKPDAAGYALKSDLIDEYDYDHYADNPDDDEAADGYCFVWEREDDDRLGQRHLIEDINIYNRVYMMEGFSGWWTDYDRGSTSTSTPTHYTIDLEGNLVYLN